MRRFLWVLGATLILALLPLTGHIAFAAEQPHTAVIGTSATTDNLAEATTNPAPESRPDRAHRHDADDSTAAAAPAPVGGSRAAVANSGALPLAPAANFAPRLTATGLGIFEQSIGLARLMPLAKTALAAFSPKFTVLGLVDHAPGQPLLPALAPLRLPLLNPFSGLPATVPRPRVEAAVPQAETGGAQSATGAASSTGGNEPTDLTGGPPLN